MILINSIHWQNLPQWHSTQRWLIEPILSSRWVPLSRWHQTRRTIASSWTSQDPVALHPSLGTWSQAWMHPTWAGLPWEWTSPGVKEWGLLGPTAKGYPSKATQDPGLRAWVCRAWKGRTRGRWVDENSALSIQVSVCQLYVEYMFVTTSQTTAASSMDQTASSLTSRGSTLHLTPLGRYPPSTTLARGCQDSSCRANTHHPVAPWASTTRCRDTAIQQKLDYDSDAFMIAGYHTQSIYTWNKFLEQKNWNYFEIFLICFIKLQQEPPFNGQTNSFTGSGYQYSQGNMNGVSPFLYHFFQYVLILHCSAVCSLMAVWFTDQFPSM